MIRVQLDPPLQAAPDRYALQLVRQLLDRPHLTALQPIQHQKEGRDEPEQQAHKAENRHLYSLAGPAVSAHQPSNRCHLVVWDALHKQHIPRHPSLCPYFTISRRKNA